MCKFLILLYYYILVRFFPLIQNIWLFQRQAFNATADNFNMIRRGDRDLARTIKEAIYIRVYNPSLNRNVGKYHLSHLWDRVLFNTPGLKIDSTQHPPYIHNNGLTQAIPTNNNSPMAADCRLPLSMIWIQSMCSEMPSNTYNCSNARLISDLMKITVVIESLCLKQSNVLYNRKKSYQDINTFVLVSTKPVVCCWIIKSFCIL